MKKSLQVREGTSASLLSGLDRMPDDSRQAVAKAWDNEIAQRLADFEAGRTQGVPHAQVRAEMRALINDCKSQIRR